MRPLPRRCTCQFQCSARHAASSRDGQTGFLQHVGYPTASFCTRSLRVIRREGKNLSLYADSLRADIFTDFWLEQYFADTLESVRVSRDILVRLSKS